MNSTLNALVSGWLWDTLGRVGDRGGVCSVRSEASSASLAQSLESPPDWNPV